MIIIHNQNWVEVIHKIAYMDVIEIKTFSDFAKDANDLKVKLEECYKKQISIKVDKSLLYPSEYIELIKMFDLAALQKIQEQKEAQLLGIKKALERKKIGLGTYGRPSVELPSDFEEQIKRHSKHKISLDIYRRQINMKKSTFYKYVHKVRNS